MGRKQDTFGSLVREALEGLGVPVTASELARLAGCSRSQAARILSGFSDPKLSTIVRVAKALDVWPSRLVPDK